MSGSERRKARDAEPSAQEAMAKSHPFVATPAPEREEGLYRITRKAGGVLIEEVSATDVHVTHQLAHDIYDIAMSRFTSELHRRVTR